MNCAVLLIPAGAAFKKIKRVGFACDLKNIYDLPLDFLEELVHTFRASLDLIRVSRNINGELKSLVSATLMKEELKNL